MRLRAEEKGFCRARSHYSVRLCLQRGWDRAPSGAVPGTLGHWDASKLGWLAGANKTHACAHNRRHTHTLQVWLKNMITNTTEVITFLAVCCMSTHAEHPCPPPFIVLLCLILFSAEMIMISLAAKYECKFTSPAPDRAHGMYGSVIIFCGQTGKERF